MDEKELKKLLEKELDHLAPPMSDKVRKAPIVTAKSDKPEKSVERKPDIKVKRFNVKPYVIGAIAAVLVIVISLALVLPPLFKGGKFTRRDISGWISIRLSNSYMTKTSRSRI